MAELGRRTARLPRSCAILVASNQSWAGEAERIIRARGYAVARLGDLQLADLVVAPGELRLVAVAAMMDGPVVASQIARLRARNADLVVISLPEPFDGDQLLRILPPAAPGTPS